MRLKSDFITNSSSASFVISKHWLTRAQIDMIKGHIEISKLLPNQSEDFPYLDKWYIEETEAEIRGRTSMDNFDILLFLRKVVGISRENINYEGGG